MNIPVEIDCCNSLELEINHITLIDSLVGKEQFHSRLRALCIVIGIKEYLQNSLSRISVAISRSHTPQMITLDS